MGFKELFELHPDLLITCLTGLINATVRVIPDEVVLLQPVLPAT